MRGLFRKQVVSLLAMLVLAFVVILLSEQNGQMEQKQPLSADLQTGAAENPGSEVTDQPPEETADVPVAKVTTKARNAIEANFGAFYDYYDDSYRTYETYLIKRYQRYRYDDLSQWKDKQGRWCYPEGYEFTWVPSAVEYMAPQQFPPELLEDMDTEELLSFIIKGKKDLTWPWRYYDNYLQGISEYYRLYNFMHDLMNRDDCAQVVHQYYQRYSDQDKEKYSRIYWPERGASEPSQKSANFQLIEGLEWFFMALEGKEVPDEYVYGSELEKTLDVPVLPQEFIYKEDITHDGVEDIIRLDMSALRDQSLATGEEETVTVTSGKTGEKIASYTADAVHSGWNGIYLYENNQGKYLVQWQPAMYQGVGTFRLKVFSLKEDGTEDVQIEKEYRFDLNPDKMDFDPKAYQDYIDLVNAYLQNSYVIIDTDQGEVNYATQEGSLMMSYDGSWVIDDYQELQKVSKKGS